MGDADNNKTHWAHAVVDFCKMLPRAVLVGVVVFALAYLTVFAVAAFVSEREVALFPPRFGPGPKQAAVQQLTDLRTELQRVSDEHYKQVTFMREKLADARSKGASIGSEAFEERRSAEKYESDIRELESQFGQHIDALQQKVAELATKACR
jgi:TolA-binding protein